MIAIIELVVCLIGGMSVGITAFLRSLPIYDALSDIKTEIFLLFIGVPYNMVDIILKVISAISLLIVISSILKKRIK